MAKTLNFKKRKIMMYEKLNSGLDEKRTGGVKIVWQEYFSKEENINNLFESIELKDYKVMNVKSTYIEDSNRYGIIVTTQNDGSGNSTNIVIDSISKEPTLTQMMDVTFGFGKDSDKRIIIYVGERRPDEINNEIMANSFAQINNDFGIDTYLIEAKKEINGKFNSDKVRYFIYGEPGGIKITEFNNHPSKSEFQKAEFWLYYESCLGFIEKRSIWDPDTLIAGQITCSFDDVETFVDWSEKGAFLYIRSCIETGIEKLLWLFENWGCVIKEPFRDYQIELHDTIDDIKHYQ